MSKNKKNIRQESNGCCPPITYTALNSGCLPISPTSSICDCCVSPLQSVLTQLVGQTVIIGTIADVPNQAPLLFLFKIIEVNDFLVTVTDGMTTYVVNISDIMGVAFPTSGPTINLLAPGNLGCECDCDCRERPIRQLLNTLIGSTVDILLVNGSFAENFKVEQTGQGIVLGTFQIPPGTFRLAISTCKITAVGRTN